jgi:hypothetical protein
MLVINIVPDEFPVVQNKYEDAEPTVVNAFHMQCLRLFACSIFHHTVFAASFLKETVIRALDSTCGRWTVATSEFTANLTGERVREKEAS